MTTFVVYGDPRPQGSKSQMLNKHTGKPIMVEGGDSKTRAANKSWRSEVVDAARAAHSGPPLDGPLFVSLRFVFSRPKSARKADHWKSTAPDIDKLERAILDALVIGRVIVDDARVAVTIKSKELADAAGAQPVGVMVEVRPLDHSTPVAFPR